MTDSEPIRTEMTCPRCGSARSKSATFCGTCGQDLRPGALVIPLLPPPEPSPAKAEGGGSKGARGLLRRKSSSNEGAAGTAASAGAAASAGDVVDTPAKATSAQSPTPAMPDQTALGPVTLPGSQTRLPKEKPAPKAESTVLAKPDTTLSFSERYRGTQYGNPDIERFLPPPRGAKRQRRWGRILLVVVLFVATLGAALAGSWFVFFSPSAIIGPGASRSSPAGASVTPRPTAEPTPTVHGLIPDEVEVAGCLLFTEDAQRQAGLAALRTDALAGGAADLAARAAAVTEAIEVSRSSLPALEAEVPMQALAAAWLALYEIEIDALAQMAAAPADAEALKAAVERLDEAAAARMAVADAQVALVAIYPEATCTVE